VQRPKVCEWTGCTDAATHVITVDLPDGGGRVWHVCSEHDKDVKRDVVRSRPRPASPPAADGSSVTVHCGDCEIPLDEPSDLPVADRDPCPICVSLKRQHRAVLTETLELNASISGTVKRSGAKKFDQRFKTGDDLTRATQTWGTRALHLDRNNDTYLEEITLHDGTSIESRAALHDHRGH
jgi:hypothetical protein